MEIITDPLKMNIHVFENKVIIRNDDKGGVFFIEPLGFDVRIEAGDIIELLLHPIDAISDLEISVRNGFLKVYLPLPYDKLDIFRNGVYEESL